MHMKRYGWLLGWWWCGTLAFAGDLSADTIFTTYDRGTFTTHCEVAVDAPEAVTAAVMNDFMRQYRSQLDSLFAWGLKDMGLRGEGDELIVYNLKRSAYDPATDLTTGWLDVGVPGLLTLRDIEVVGHMYLADSVPPGETVVQYDILRATGFIKEADATLRVVHTDRKHARCTLDMRVRFGWFFNLFVSQKVYRKNLEWRFMQLADNLREEATRRSAPSTFPKGEL